MAESKTRFYFRINKVKVKDNMEKGGFFKKDRAEVKLFSFVTTGNTDLPELAQIGAGSPVEEKRKAIMATVERCISTRRFIEIDNVKDNQQLKFGKTGYVLYQDDVIPDDFNWIFLAIESDEKNRDFGKQLEDTVNSENFDKFSDNLLTLIGKTATKNPAYAAGMAVAKFITGIFADILKNNDDDLLGVLYTSLNRPEHYPHCFRNDDDVDDLTNNLKIDYSIFGYENQQF